jgi:hypothetical protein
MQSQTKKLKIETWIKQNLNEKFDIIIATETHLTHQPYFPQYNSIKTKYASFNGILQLSSKAQ